MLLCVLTDVALGYHKDDDRLVHMFVVIVSNDVTCPKCKSNGETME